jgi:hypothetical protein
VRPGAEIQSAQFGDVSTVTLLTVLVKRRRPGLLGQGENGLAHWSGEVEADREAQPALAHRVDEFVGGARGVAAHQDGLDALAGGELCETGVEHRDGVGSVVGGGVAGTQDAGEHLLGFVEGAEQWVEAEAALVRRRCTFLLGVSGDQGTVDIEGDAPWLAGSPGR